MSDKPIAKVSVPITEADKQAIADVLDSSPFKQDTLLMLALRVGLREISKDPTILMPYLAKKSPPG